MYSYYFYDFIWRKKYINQNTALVGAIIENNPELEEEIVPIITKGNTAEYYSIGNNILDKYHYNENLSSIKNPILKDSYSNFKLTIILLWGVFFLVVIVLILNIISPIFNNIKKLGERADEMVEGNFNYNELKFQEGDFYVFYNKFTHMGERLENALKDLLRAINKVKEDIAQKQREEEKLREEREAEAKKEKIKKER